MKNKTAQILPSLSRRHFLTTSGAALTCLASTSSLISASVKAALSLNQTNEQNLPERFLFASSSLKAHLAELLGLPKQYQLQLLDAWHLPLKKKNDHQMTKSIYKGVMHSGLCFFPLTQSNEGLLIINHSSIDIEQIHDKPITLTMGARNSLEQVNKEIDAHGLSILHIKENKGLWVLEKNSRLHQRITATTATKLTGPIAHSLKTPSWLQHHQSIDKTSTIALGILGNNKGTLTPWGTYLNGEKSWSDYFTDDLNAFSNKARADDNLWFDIDEYGSKYAWETVLTHTQLAKNHPLYPQLSRFDLSKSPHNESERFGFLVEIDPTRPKTPPKKRTALGRLKHGQFSFGEIKQGQPICIYLTDAQAFGYVYKYLSKKSWNSVKKDKISQLGDEYLDQGNLFVARFNANGQGQWLPLNLKSKTKNNTFLAKHFDTMAQLLLNPAKAAELVDATPMDSPDACLFNPLNQTIYLSLKMNEQRSATNHANPYINNLKGHLIAFKETNHCQRFLWQFLQEEAESKDKQLNCPSGLSIDPAGNLWIQTSNKHKAYHEADNLLMISQKHLVNQPLSHPFNKIPINALLAPKKHIQLFGSTFSPDGRHLFINFAQQKESNDLSHQEMHDLPHNSPYSMETKSNFYTICISSTDGKTISSAFSGGKKTEQIGKKQI